MEAYKELQWKEPPLYTANQDEVLNNLPSDPVQPKPTHIPLHAETTALVVVDVQPEYWSKCPSVRKDFPDFPDNLRRTIEVCRERKAKILWVRADYRYSHSPWLAQFARLHKGKKDMMTEVPCDPLGEDFKWEEFATPEGGESIVAKTSWSSVTNTALVDHLRGSGIDTVLVCGLITSVCVQHSAFGIFEAGFRTLLVTDACGDRGRARHEAALALYGDYMYELVTSRDLENPINGLLKAKPVWLIMDSSERKSTNAYLSDEDIAGSFTRLQSFGRLQEAITAIGVKESNAKVAKDHLRRVGQVDDDAPPSMASSVSSTSRGKSSIE